MFKVLPGLPCGRGRRATGALKRQVCSVFPGQCGALGDPHPCPVRWSDSPTTSQQDCRTESIREVLREEPPGRPALG